MIWSYQEVIKKYKSDYQINKAINDNCLIKIEKGIYSDKKIVNPLAIMAKKYPDAIVTLDNAFYYYKLTDTIPRKIYLSTDNRASKITDKRVEQIYILSKYFKLGITKIKIDGIDINIYDRERLLVELLRKKNIIPIDYYKEIIKNYREIIDELDMQKVDLYISKFSNSDIIYNTLQREVF